MRDLAFVAFLGAFLLLGLRRPFLFVLAYAYVDIVAPQRLSYYLLSGGSIVLYAAIAALAASGSEVRTRKSAAIVPRLCHF